MYSIDIDVTTTIQNIIQNTNNQPKKYRGNF